MSFLDLAVDLQNVILNKYSEIRRTYDSNSKKFDEVLIFFSSTFVSGS